MPSTSSSTINSTNSSSSTTSGLSPHELRRAAPGAFRPAELPSVLYYMVRIKAAPPPEWLRLYTDALAPCVPVASARLLSQLLFALARARSAPPAALLAACLTRAEQLRGGFSPGDAAMLMWSLGVVAASEVEEHPLAAASGDLITIGGACGSEDGGSMRPPVTPGWLDVHLASMEQLLPLMDHRQLAMMIWSLGRLRHRPSPSWMGSFLAAARQLLGPADPTHPLASPAGQSSNDTAIGGRGGSGGAPVSLLSVSTLLASLQALDFLPPTAFMAAAHSAASAAIWEDPSPSPAQRELLSERVNTAVAWYKQRVQQLLGASSPGGGGSPSNMASCDESGSGSGSSSGGPETASAQVQRRGNGAREVGPAVVAAAAAAVGGLGEGPSSASE